MKLSKSQLLTAGGFWSFLVFGFIDNLKGPLLPEMVRSGRFNYAQAGTLILASYIGFIIATLTAGLLADRLSNRVVMWLAAICLCLGGFSIGLCHGYAWLLVAMFSLGYGLGAIELGANALMIQLHWRSPGRYLNLLSVFHGCGSLIVPLVAAQLIGLSWHWQSIYALSWLMALPLLVLFWSLGQPDRAPAAPLHQAAANQNSLQESSTSSQVAKEVAAMELAPVRLWPNGFTWLMWRYYGLIASYVAVELSIGTWMMETLQATHAISVECSSYYLSAFFVLLMLGRLSGAMFVERWHYLTAITVALCLTLLCLTAAIFGDRWHNQWAWRWFFPISGLCMSIIFPTITASVSRVHGGQAGAIMGVLFAFGGIGGALGPWVVAQVGQRSGLTLGLAATLVMNVISLGFAISLCGRHRYRRACVPPTTDKSSRGPFWAG